MSLSKLIENVETCVALRFVVFLISSRFFQWNQNFRILLLDDRKTWNSSRFSFPLTKIYAVCNNAEHFSDRQRKISSNKSHKTFLRQVDEEKNYEQHSLICPTKQLELGDEEGKSFSVRVDIELGQWPPPTRRQSTICFDDFSSLEKSCKSFQQLWSASKTPSKHQQTIVAGSSHFFFPNLSSIF